MINHQKLKNEVLDKFISEDLEGYLPSELLAKNLKLTSHLESIHESLHVLTGGSVTRPMVGTITPNAGASTEYVLLMFDAFKAVADGVLSSEDFEKFPHEKNALQSLLKLTNGDQSQVKKLFKLEESATSPEELQILCTFVAESSKAYIAATSQWINNVAREGRDLDVTKYMLRVQMAEESQKAEEPLTPVNKIYLNSNIARACLEGRGTAEGLEGFTESPGTSTTSRSGATVLKDSSNQVATKL